MAKSWHLQKQVGKIALQWLKVERLDRFPESRRMNKDDTNNNNDTVD